MHFEEAKQSRHDEYELHGREQLAEEGIHFEQVPEVGPLKVPLTQEEPELD